ncbi:MAG: hypothetical protein C7B47_15955 [Sulfobacillus thermosulfidooxidans]|uniref:Uncharacterized protein n=1 Tax=Sulfobacillus thermosulfidooxidans TaxID=28034 RepID=A0A2T2WM22_SULTH|nr:MAG: hypothetical protein C7B47_15955 [Sulfobacillus thermosulfidooxidans]
MARNVAALVLAAINACWRERITLPTLLDILQHQRPPGVWIGPVGQLFTDVPVSALQRWLARHQMDSRVLQAYYQRYIVPLGDRNPELEAWFDAEHVGTSL